jgi:hypothetical protein
MHNATLTPETPSYNEYTHVATIHDNDIIANGFRNSDGMLLAHVCVLQMQMTEAAEQTYYYHCYVLLMSNTLDKIPGKLERQISIEQQINFKI